MTLAAVANAFALSLLILHHQTEDYFTPLVEYFSSFKLAIPPVALFLASYVMVFLTGVSLADVPKTALGWARNVYFQSRAVMIFTLIASGVLTGYTVWLSLRVTPPAYEHLVHALLTGESDSLAAMRDKVVDIRKVDFVMAGRLDKILAVFLERAEVNAGHRQLSGDRSHVLVVALEADTDPRWDNHPLRNHALAEAYSLLGQSILEPNSKRVERFQPLVIPSCRQTRRDHQCRGPKPLDASMRVALSAIQAT